MIKLASVLDESDFAYGFKENEKIEIEVFLLLVMCIKEIL